MRVLSGARGVKGTVRVLGGLLAAFLLAGLPSADAAGLADLGATPPALSKAAGTPVAASPSRSEPATTTWLTRQRMRDARPVSESAPPGRPGLLASGNEASTSSATGDFTPVNVTSRSLRIHGKLFIKMGEETYVCSGTVVESARRNVILTAGHCVFDRATQQWFQRIAFVPAYENEATPYGIFEGQNWITPQRWIDHGDYSYDLGLVVLKDPVQHLGARKLAFDLNPLPKKTAPRNYTIFGYPTSPAELYDGEFLQGCKVQFDGYDRRKPNTSPYPIAARPCSMMQGSSGGGWVTLGNYLSSVTSYGYCESLPEACGRLHGPVLSDAARSLYTHRDSGSGLNVGGSYRPTLRMVKAPPRVVRKRSVPIRVTGRFATLPGFYYRVDARKPRYLSGKVRMTGLSPGRHTVRIRAVDQLGRKSKRTIVRKFRVVLKKRR